MAEIRPRGGPVALPEFCDWRLLLMALAVAELAVLTIALAPGGEFSWRMVGTASVFAQWLALLAVALLCAGRRFIARWSRTTRWLLAWGLVVVLAWGLASVLAWINSQMITGLIPIGNGFAGRVTVITALVTAAFLRYLYIRQQWEQQWQAQTEARVHALQSRIQPHFLFNSLNTIAGLIDVDRRAAEDATLNLADLLRGSLRRTDQLASVDDELALARLYLSMEQARLGDRLQLHWQIDDTLLDAEMPPLVLQPLLENAVRHGIEPLAEGGIIQVQVQPEGNDVGIVIRNPMAAEASGRPGFGMALNNIDERLAYAYGGQASLQAQPVRRESAGDGPGNDESGSKEFVVKMRFPYVTGRSG